MHRFPPVRTYRLIFFTIDILGTQAHARSVKLRKLAYKTQYCCGHWNCSTSMNADTFRKGGVVMKTGPTRRETSISVAPGRPGMALFTVTMGVALILLVTTQTAVLEAAVSQLPPSMKRIVRGAQNYVIVSLAPVRDGLRWIDVADPRSRRSDKLRTTAQSD